MCKPLTIADDPWTNDSVCEVKILAEGAATVDPVGKFWTNLPSIRKRVRPVQLHFPQHFPAEGLGFRRKPTHADRQ